MSSRNVGIIFQTEDKNIHQSGRYSVEFEITKIEPTEGYTQNLRVQITDDITSVRYEGLKNPVIIYGKPTDSYEFKTVDEKASDRYEFRCKLIIRFKPEICDVHLIQNPLPSYVVTPPVKSLSNLLETGKYSDFTIKVANKEFKVHKSVLSQASSFFETMFDCGLDESKNNFAELKDIEPDIFQNLLDFIYGGKLPKNLSDVAFELYAAAHLYQIDSLKVCCAGHIYLTPISMDNFLELKKFASCYEMDKMLERIALFTKLLENSKEITAEELED